MFVIKYKWVFFLISGLLVVGSIVSLFTFGLKLGIDFTGGSIVEVAYPNGRPAEAVLRADADALSKTLASQVTIQPSGENEVLVRARDLTQAEKNGILNTLAASAKAPVTEKQFNSIGPSIGSELAKKGLIAIILVVLVIVLFITFTFRHVSRPVSSWKYGVVAIVTLLHDVVIPAGVFAYLGHYHGTEVGALFLTALLAIMGLSVSDTIVIFDRIRENLRNKISPHFEYTVGQSLSETFTRSLNTSLTVILALLALYFFGENTTKDFALALTIGMIVGTYSSIFVASPLLVVWEKWGRK